MGDEFREAIEALLGDHALRLEIASDLGDTLGPIVDDKIQERITALRSDLEFMQPQRLKHILEQSLETGAVMSFGVAESPDSELRYWPLRKVVRKMYRLSVQNNVSQREHTTSHFPLSQFACRAAGDDRRDERRTGAENRDHRGRDLRDSLPL